MGPLKGSTIYGLTGPLVPIPKRKMALHLFVLWRQFLYRARGQFRKNLDIGISLGEQFDLNTHFRHKKAECRLPGGIQCQK